MTEDEARKVARIIATADGGCSYCVSALCEKMTLAGFGFEFRVTGEEIEVSSDWSDEPEDAMLVPEVLVIPSGN